VLAFPALLNHAPTMIATRAERAFLSALEGGCQVPIGALAIEADDGMVLHGLIAEVTGRRVVRGERAFNGDDPELVGVRLANDLRSQGGTEVLGTLRGMEKVPSPQPE
jgi:hydroxymethylbilane synthase